MSFIGSILSLAFGLFFLNDLYGLLVNGKWDGLLYFLCEHDCLITVDKIALVLCLVVLLMLAPATIQRYRWKYLLVPIFGGLVWLLIMMLHLLIVYIFFI